jgi:hypothetical protein
LIWQAAVIVICTVRFPLTVVWEKPGAAPNVQSMIVEQTILDSDIVPPR